MTVATATRFKLLDAFRGIAIIWIVCFHLLVDVRQQYGGLIDFLLQQGWAGVSLFLVISGYGIAASMERAVDRNEPMLQFLGRRLQRIYLTYWCYLLFGALIIPMVSALVSMLNGHSYTPEFTHYTLPEWLEIVTLLKIFTATSWKLALAFLPLNGALWFIAIIVQIYIVTSLTLVFGRRYQYALFLLFVLSLLSLVQGFDDRVPYGLFLPYFCQFYVGMALYTLIKRNILLPAKSPVPTVLAVATLAILGAVILSQLFSEFVFAVCGGMLFWLLYPFDRTLNRFLPVRIFYILGTFSYSLYLLHLSLAVFFDIFVRHLVPLAPAIAIPLVLIPCVVVASFFWYLFFERPGTLRRMGAALRTPIRTLLSYRSALQT